MASSTVMAASSTKSRNPDPPRRTSSSSDHNTTTTITSNNSMQTQLLNAGLDDRRRTVEDVWKGIVAGEGERKVCKVEVPDDMMTLEDFLVRAGAVDKEEVAEDVKVRVPLSGSVSAGVGMMSSRLFSFDSVPLSPFPSGGASVYGSGLLGSSDGGGCNDGGGIGRGKRRGSGVIENLDRAAQKRQRRMIKNRESAARSRERKQEHQVKLESLASKLEEENEQLLNEKAAQTKERLKLLMEKIIPVVEQRKPPRPLRRVNSWQW
ncbi:unnamed protein product [Rhodiola kirilowii]